MDKEKINDIVSYRGVISNLPPQHTLNHTPFIAQGEPDVYMTKSQLQTTFPKLHIDPENNYLDNQLVPFKAIKETRGTVGNYSVIVNLTVNNTTNREVNLGAGLDVHVSFETGASVANILFSADPIIPATSKRLESFTKTVESAGKKIETVSATVRSNTKNDVVVLITAQPSTNNNRYPVDNLSSNIIIPANYSIPDGTTALTLDVTITLKNG